MMTYRRLIESAFPLTQASIDSVHEKSVRHGHISTLHIWPARRPSAASRAALSSPIWLVCRKCRCDTRLGWDNAVLREMQANITAKLRSFWDANIRGPHFVWAATGPALEAFSQRPVVRRTDTLGAVLTVTEFLRHVRRMVVAFVVNRPFATEGEATVTLDDPTNLLPAAPQRLRHGRRAGRRLRPPRPLVQRLGRGLGRAVEYPGPWQGG